MSGKQSRLLFICTFFCFLCCSAYAAPIHDAAAKGDLQALESLLSGNPELAKAPDNSGATPLHYAAATGETAVMRVLIAKGADVNAEKKDGVTPLHVAAALAQVEAAELLISNGADLNAVDKKGRTPLAAARRTGTGDMVRLLVARMSPSGSGNYKPAVRMKLLEMPKHTPIVRKPGSPGTKAVTYARTSVRGCPVNVITADLNDARVTVDVAISRNGIGTDETFGSFIQRCKPTAAINAAYFSKDNLKPIGDIVINGKLANFGAMGSGVCFTEDFQTDFITVIRHSHMDWSGYRTVLCCGPRLLEQGQVVVDASSEGFRDPHVMGNASRTAVGLTAKNKLILANTTRGISFTSWANVMKALGCVEAVNMDAGASLGMYYRGKTIVSPGRRLTNVLLVYEFPQGVQTP